jgi:hypothetical protein
MAPPTYSRSDTEQTQREVKRTAADIREHNAAYDAVCPAAAPRKAGV